MTVLLLVSSPYLQEDPSGRLDYHEVKSAIRAMGFVVHKAQLLQILEQCCEDADGLGVTKQEFDSVAMRFITQRTAIQEITRDFLVFDTRRRWGLCPPPLAFRVNAQVARIAICSRLLLLLLLLAVSDCLSPRCFVATRGFIDLEDVQRVSRQTGGHKKSDSDLAAMISRFDSDKDGRFATPNIPSSPSIQIQADPGPNSKFLARSADMRTA